MRTVRPRATSARFDAASRTFRTAAAVASLGNAYSALLGAGVFSGCMRLLAFVCFVGLVVRGVGLEIRSWDAFLNVLTRGRGIDAFCSSSSVSRLSLVSS